MAIRDVMEFLKTAWEDDALKAKLQDLCSRNDLEGLIHLGQERGCNFSRDDFADALKAAQKPVKLNDELSDDELSRVAGGVGGDMASSVGQIPNNLNGTISNFEEQAQGLVSATTELYQQISSLINSAP